MLAVTNAQDRRNATDADSVSVLEDGNVASTVYLFVTNNKSRRPGRWFLGWRVKSSNPDLREAWRLVQLKRESINVSDTGKETRKLYVYRGTVTRPSGQVAIIHTPRHALGEITPEVRSRINTLAGNIEIPSRVTAWDGQEWVRALLVKMVEKDILSKDICNSALAWARGDVGYI